MKTTSQLDKLPTYHFAKINQLIEQKKEAGVDVISLAIGDPDLPTPKFVIDSLIESSQIQLNHQYPESEGTYEFRHAVKNFYERRFGVELSVKDQIISLIGAKEGIAHASFAFLNFDDIAIIPNPAYPVYKISTILSGAKFYEAPLQKQNNFLLMPEDIPSHVANNAKLLWINYPNNPTGTVATTDYYRELVNFAAHYDLMVLSDNCYSEMTFSDYLAPSILQVDGALESCIEFHSLSKIANMTGWRIGMAVGNSELIGRLLKLKTNLDSGIPQAIQSMAIIALNNIEKITTELKQIYFKRAKKIVDVLKELNIEAEIPQGGLYVWCRVLEGFTSESFATHILEKCDVVISPGNNFGNAGEGFFRISLTISDDLLDKAASRLIKVLK